MTGRHSCAAIAVAVLTLIAPLHTETAGPPGVVEAQGRGAPLRRPSAPARTELRGEEALRRVYDSILEARFDQVESELRKACGPAPPEACDVLAATAVWWRILLDPDSRALDNEFSAAIERAIRRTEAWTRRSPDEAESWFYLGGAYAARVQWGVLRGEKLAAARDGKRIRHALERAIELAPGLDDAYFGIGLYRYYAAVAPAAARVLRFLLVLPGGNREEGLEQMLRVREHGRLLQGEADYQLHLIYLWYERDTDRAVELLRGLHQHYPGNPLFLARIAEIQDTYQHDITASLDTWRTLLGMAREQRVNAAGIAEVRARLGVARQLEELHQTDHAVEQLEALVALEPRAPYSSLAIGYLKLGEAHDRMGARAKAAAAYRSAVATAPADDPHEVADQATDRIRRTPDARQAEAYRLSLEGWRRLEQNDLAGAAALLERSLALKPRDPVAHYRYGRVLQTRGDDTSALAQLETAIRDGRGCPPPILAAAYLEAARVHERAGHRDQALAWYAVASTLFGAGPETRAAAVRALTRLK